MDNDKSASSKQELNIAFKSNDIEVGTVIKNILKKCKEECENNKLQLALDDFSGRAANYTGLPKILMNHILEEENKYANDEPFDVFARMLILKSLLNCYTSKRVIYPKLFDVFPLVQEALKLKDIDLFRHKMIKMGFDYRNTKSGKLLLAEDAKLFFERYNYLKKIKKYREDKVKIYYIDERVIDKTLKFPKPDFLESNNREKDACLDDGLYLYHVLSNTGLDNYLYTNKKSQETYHKWLFDVLVRMLDPGSVIIIDDHPLHGKLEDETITRQHSKSEMLDWLKKRQVPCNSKMHRAELYELISKCVRQDIDYYIDRVLKAHGFDVLRLPFGCKSLSPATLLWKEMAGNTTPEITNFTVLELDEKIIPAVISFHNLNWKKLDERITYWEDQFMDIDIKTDGILDQLITFENIELPSLC